MNVVVGKDYRRHNLIGVLFFGCFLLVGLIFFLWPRSDMRISDVAMSFCGEAGDYALLAMQDSLDSDWITIQHVPPKKVWGRDYVVDRRTAFKISTHDLVELGKNCTVAVTPQKEGLVVERLCDVVFLVSPDWKIRAIMDEKTWKERGQEIVNEVIAEISSETPVPLSPTRTPTWVEKMVQDTMKRLGNGLSPAKTPSGGNRGPKTKNEGPESPK